MTLTPRYWKYTRISQVNEKVIPTQVLDLTDVKRVRSCTDVMRLNMLL
jgi:hypothetical protein